MSKGCAEAKLTFEGNGEHDFLFELKPWVTCFTCQYLTNWQRKTPGRWFSVGDAQLIKTANNAAALGFSLLL